MSNLIYILAHSENAMNFMQFQQQSGLPTSEVAETLDSLVRLGIFRDDISLHSGDLGEIVYMFGCSEDAQRAFKDALGEV